MVQLDEEINKLSISLFLIKRLTGLVERIRNKKEPNGAWRLFYDEEEGNITATFEAYYALLYSGYLDKTNTNPKFIDDGQCY